MTASTRHRVPAGHRARARRLGRWRATALGVVLALVASATPAAAAPHRAAPVHTVTYDRYSIRLDGQPTYIWSAEFHYFRLPSPDAWRDVLQKVRSAGFNAVSLYFAWSYHSPAPGSYDFTGIRDVDRLLTMAEEAGLFVIARPGPYINAEMSGGGFPAWRGTRPGVNRTSEPGYLSDAAEWMHRINPIIARHQYTRGTGGVILYQVENEYQGGRHDGDYMEAVKSWAKQDGIEVPTFINDGGANGNWVEGKGAADMYGFDAYPQGFDCRDPQAWRDLPDYSWVRKYSPNTPMLTPEAQGGAFDPWGGAGYDKCRELTGPQFTRVFTKMSLAAGIALQNFYMTFGGTNWGWLADPNAVYTSYDYGAPITESRQLTDKYAEFKRLGHFLAAVKSMTRTDAAVAPHPDDDALRTDRRVNPDDGTQFLFLRHADTRVTDTHHTRLALSGRDGDYPAIPQQGTITVAGRDAKLLVASYDMGGQRLVYSTSEILTHARIGHRDVAVLYGREGEDGETVLRYGSRPQVRVLSGRVQSTWDGRRGDLRLNYPHRDGAPARVLISGGGRSDLELILGTDAEAAAWWRQETPAGPVLIRGPHLVRTAATGGGALRLAGDTTGTGPLEVIGPDRLTRVTWNGYPVATTRTAAGSLAGRLGAEVRAAPRQVVLPDLDTWRTHAETPESAPGFDDSTWTVADHLTAVHPSLAGTLPVLAADEYGYHHGDVWYRGRFAGTGGERTDGQPTVTVTTATGAQGLSAVWLNGHYLGASGERTHPYAIPAGVLRADNVLAVLVENSGHSEEWGHDFSKEPRGLISAALGAGSGPITWRIQGNRGGERPVDPVRGPFNSGGLYGERAGWSLPGFPDRDWSAATLPDRGRQPGVRWYRTSFPLNLPAAQDTALGLRIDDAPNRQYRADLFVNGWLVGRYLNGVGPQHEFVIPRGLLNEHGRNTVAVAVWSTDSSGLGRVRLVNLGAVAGGPAISTVPAPGWDRATYRMPVAAAGVRIDGGPLQAGVPAGVSASFTASATARDVTLSLAAPDGWTVTPDGPVRRSRVRPGETFTARWIVTPSHPVQSYPLLRARATFTRDGARRAVADARAVQVRPPTPAGDVYVSDLPLVRSTNGWGPVELDTSNGEDAARDGRPLSVGGTGYAKGLGTHAPSSVRVWLGGNCAAFNAVVGVDDEVGDAGSVTFAVVGDGSTKTHTGVLTGMAAGQRLTVDVTGVRWLDLDVTDGADNGYSDHADWADARLSCSPDPGFTPRSRAVPDRLMTLSGSSATWRGRS